MIPRRHNTVSVITHVVILAEVRKFHETPQYQKTQRTYLHIGECLLAHLTWLVELISTTWHRVGSTFMTRGQ